MNEENKTKREWVKSAAIVFLSVMLVLTFFSNTFMNYSLPEVATQRIQSGTITAKIRGTGTIESSDPYNVEVTQSRKISGVAVKQGDKVEMGDVILYLEDEESEELALAETALEEAQLAFKQALLKGEIDYSVFKNAQNGVTSSSTDYQGWINGAKAAVQDGENRVNYWKEKSNALANQIAISGADSVDTKDEEAALATANTNLSNAQLNLKSAEEALSKFGNSVSDNDPGKVAAQKKVDQWKESVKQLQQAVNNAQLALDKKKIEGDKTSTIANLTQQKAIADSNMAVEQTALDKKKKELEDTVNNIQQEITLSGQNTKIAELTEKVEKLRADSVGATVTASVAGTVTSISVVAGQNTTPGTPVAVIQPEGKGYSLSFSITNEQAKRVAIGDPADLVNAWWYSDITAKVSGIKPDPTDPGKKKLLVFELTGELTGGQSLSLSVGQKSANYDMIVPNSAIREDNNGKFILIIESKNTPLGNRFIATRVDVEVLASDDTQSAVTGGLYGYEDVITTSTKPIEAGKQVRLAD